MNNEKMIRKATKPREIANTVSAYLAEGDLDGIMTLFHPDCVVYFPQNEPPKKGTQAVRELFDPFAQSKAILISKVTRELINGDTAMLQADWSMKDADGNVMAEGSSTEVAKQNADGSWVYYIDCPYGPPVV